jgi:hypothetical protein
MVRVLVSSAIIRNCKALRMDGNSYQAVEKEMVGTRGLEPLPCQSGVNLFFNDLQPRGDCLNTRKSWKRSSFVGWIVGR